MPTITVRPNSDILNTGVTPSTGAVDNTLLNDNSDTTYDRFVDNTSTALTVGLGNPSPAAGALLKSMTVRVRLAAESVTGGQLLVDVATQGLTGNCPSNQQTYTITSTQISTQSFAAQTVDACGNPINYTSVQLEMAPNFPAGTSNQHFRVYETYVDWLFANPPTNSVPTVGNGTSSTPTISWTYTQGTDGGPQTRYEIKIFNSVTYGLGGFSPDTSTADYSVVVASNATSAVVPAGYLVGGSTYKAYVRVAQTVNGQYQASINGTNGWQVSASAFTVTAPPALPVLTVTPDAANARTALTLTGKDNLLQEQDANLDLTTGVGNWVNNANATPSRNTNTTFTDGDIASLQVTSIAAGDMSVAQASVTTQMPPVVVGNVYSFTARVKSASQSRAARLDVVWLTAAGAVISTSTGGGFTSAPAGFATVTNANLTAPATAAFAKIVLVVVATGAANEVHYWDHIGMFNGTTAPAWTRGGYYAPGATATKTYVIQYSDDGGVTWATVRGASALTDNGASTQVATISDYEQTPNVTRTYRAYAAALEGGTTTTTTAYTATQTSTIDLTDWWLKDPSNSALNMIVYVVDEGTMTRRLPRGVFDVLGLPNSVVIKDQRKAVETTLILETTTNAERTALLALLNSEDTLLLQSPSALGPVNRYIEVGDASDVRMSQIGTLFWREWSLPYIEVVAP